nr:hypothetical protein [Tanacetum cinerariifolium]
SNLSKKKINDSDASGSTQPPAPQSSAWQTPDTRETPTSSSKHRTTSHSKQPVEGILIPDTTIIYDSKDTDSAYLSKIKPMLELLKPISKEDRPATLEPDWSIPTKELPKPENNLAKSYKDFEEKIYFRRLMIWDHSSHGFAKELGRRNSAKCHRMLMDQVDLVNPEGYRLVPDVTKLLPMGDHQVRILEKLDHMVKDFKLYEYNLGMETQIWSQDVRRRSKDFIEVIERRLKIQRIFRSLESFVGRRLRDVDYRLIQRME